MRLFAPLLLSVSALLPLAAQTRKKPVTLEALSAAAMPDFGGQPIWAPDGKRFLVRQGGKLLLYDVPSKSQSELLDTAELRGAVRGTPASAAMGWENRRVAERPVQWSDSGKQLLLLHEGDLFLFDLASRKTEQLTATAERERDPKLSPDASRVSFRRGYDLYALEIAKKQVTRLTSDGTVTLWNGMLDWVYPEELDIGTAHWWSPDSRSIAFLQFDVSRETLYPHADFMPIEAVAEPQRYPKAGTPNADVRVGVVAASGGTVRWMNFGETREHLIARLAWTPDSRGVAVHRMNRIQSRLELKVAEAASGEARTLLTETDPHWINLNDDFRFLKDGWFLWSSERDGFRHLYLYDREGKLKTRLTQGGWEVSAVQCVDEAARKVYYLATEASPLERQLYVSGLDGNGMRRLSSGAGTHGISMSPACDYYLDSFSSITSPSRRTLHKAADGAEWAVYREADTKAQETYELLKPELLSFRGPGGLQFHARLIRPAGFDPARKYPAIVFVYGGPHGQTVRNSWQGVSLEQLFAHRGFVVWQMDNRGSAGRGHAWETPLHRRMGKTELEDQKAGVAHLVSLGFVDPARVGIYGWSYGGYMTLYSLLHAPEVFAAGVAGAAVTDWRNYDTIYTERYLGLPQENEQGYRDSSPVHAAANLQGKLMLIHNFEDDNVLFANALQMSSALANARKQFEFLLYPQKSHGVTGRARQHMNEAMQRFFEAALKGN